jgi:hypothetical protein
MKIAIPTNDGILMAEDPRHTKGYLILTIEGGEVSQETLRWNTPYDQLMAAQGQLDHLKDCSHVIKHIHSNPFPAEQTGKITFITTAEVIITRIIMEYLNVSLLRESNTCCSP